MKKLLQIIVIVIIILFILAALYFLDGLEYTEAEKNGAKSIALCCLLRCVQKSLGIENLKREIRLIIYSPYIL